MKDLESGIADKTTLQALGRASVQIVHDVKNQLNGLKLYATFLRKRMEKADRPEDERETVAKLIAGLERAAGDMTALVRYARPIELRYQPKVDLVRIVGGIVSAEGFEAIRVVSEGGSVEGEFDPVLMTEAIKAITVGSRNMRTATQTEPITIHIKRVEGDESAAVIEWRETQAANGNNPFQSFAGSDALRMSVAARIIEAHGGEAGHTATRLHVRVPLSRMANSNESQIAGLQD